MEKGKGIIGISCSESIPAPILEILKQSIKEIFKKEVKIKSLEDNPTYALDQIRFQYNAALIIKEHEKRKSDFEKEIILLSVDLFIPIFTHIFGEAKLNGKIAVISTFRLKDKAEKITEERAVKVVLHEIGHLYGLTHCQENGCLMQFSGDIEHLDKIELELCDYCKFKLNDVSL